jgi:hypothetical protein
MERLVNEIHAYKEVLSSNVDMNNLSAVFAKLGVGRDSPILIPALLDPDGKPHSYW